MSKWPATKARLVYAALLRIGWSQVREASGSHVTLEHPEFEQRYVWAFHDRVEIGPRMLARIARQTGLTPEDL